MNSLTANSSRRVTERIAALRTDPRPPGCIKLKGKEDEYRIRVGDYRVRYEVRDDERLVLLLYCKHRKDVYKSS